MNIFKQIFLRACIIFTLTVTALFLITDLIDSLGIKGLTPTLIYVILGLSLVLGATDYFIAAKVGIGRAFLLLFVDIIIIDGILAFKFVRGYDNFEQFVGVTVITSAVTAVVITIRFLLKKKVNKPNNKEYKELFK